MAILFTKISKHLLLMVMNIPKQMKAVQFERYEDNLLTAIKSLHVVTKPVPSPGPGQVLIQVKASPCNPSDLLFLQGKYGVTKTLPTSPGWEGAGIVVASGGGFLPWWLKGKRVAFVTQSDRDGTWAEYCVADSKMCIPLKDKIDFEHGATLITNPFTAIGMVRTAQNSGHKAIVQTAAASQLGRMVVRLASRYDIPLINIVRRQQQADLLKSLGAQYILNSEDKDFFREFKALAQQLQATCAFDAVAGPMTGTILSGLPPKSLVLVYGGLSKEACSGISPLSLTYEGKSIEGFFLTKWLQQQGIFGLIKISNEVQDLMAEGVLASSIYKTVSLEEAPGALEEYSKQMTRGKVIIKPSNSSI